MFNPTLNEIVDFAKTCVDEAIIDGVAEESRLLSVADQLVYNKLKRGGLEFTDTGKGERKNYKFTPRQTAHNYLALATGCSLDKIANDADKALKFFLESKNPDDLSLFFRSQLLGEISQPHLGPVEPDTSALTPLVVIPFGKVMMNMFRRKFAEQQLKEFVG